MLATLQNGRSGSPECGCRNFEDEGDEDVTAWHYESGKGSTDSLSHDQLVVEVFIFLVIHPLMWSTTGNAYSSIAIGLLDSCFTFFVEVCVWMALSVHDLSQAVESTEEVY